MVSKARSSATAPFSALRGAEIDAGGQLTHTEDIKSVPDDIRAQGTGAGQRFKHLGRAKIAEQIKMFSQRQKSRPFRLLFRRQAFPFRTTDRTKKNGIAFFTKASVAGGRASP